MKIFATLAKSDRSLDSLNFPQNQFQSVNEPLNLDIINFGSLILTSLPSCIACSSALLLHAPTEDVI